MLLGWGGRGVERVKLSSSGLHNSTPVDSEVETSNVTFNACAEKIKLHLMQTNKVPMQCIPPSMKVY